MKSNEPYSLISEESFSALKVLALVGIASGGAFCLYRYLTSDDKPTLVGEDRVTDQYVQSDNEVEDDTQTGKQNEEATFTSRATDFADDGQMVIAEQQQPGTTTYNSIGSAYNIGQATFVLGELPKEIVDRLGGLMEKWVENNPEKIQQIITSEYKLLKEKNKELEARLADQEKVNHDLEEALNMIALYSLKGKMGLCEVETNLVTNEESFTIEEKKKYLKEIQNKTLKIAKELFEDLPTLSGAVEHIEEVIVTLNGQTLEHNDN